MERVGRTTMPSCSKRCDSTLLRMRSAISHAASRVLFQAYAATVFCFGAWSYLMHRYPTATVAPFSLLVPVFGMLSGVLFLGEPMVWWKGVAALLVVGGLALTQLEGRFSAFLEWFDASSEGDSNG